MNEVNYKNLIPTSLNSINFVRIVKYDPIHNLLWIGTQTKGLVVAKLNNDFTLNNFSHYNQNPNSLDNNDYICDILLDNNNNSWVGTKNGLFQIKLNKDGAIVPLKFDDEAVQKVFNDSKDNESFQKNALSLINYDDSIPETIDKSAFIALLKAIPQNKRTIEWRNRPAAIIMADSENHPFFVQDLERGTSSFQITALYGYGGDWRRKSQGTHAEDKAVYSALFDYLR